MHETIKEDEAIKAKIMNDLGWLNKGKLRGLGGMLPNEQFLIKTVEGGYLQEQLNRRAEFS